MTGAVRTDFWSRRKAAVEAEAEAAAAREEVVAAETREAESAEKTDEELLADLGLPDPDKMQKGDDFAAFMRSAVPERLRRRALRQLWRSNPVLANLDGLVDHGEDYSDKATVVPGMQTAYQVGRGMLSHILAKDEVRAVAVTPEPEPEPEPDLPEEIAEAAQPDEEPQEMPTPPRRHMRFDFPDQQEAV